MQPKPCVVCQGLDIVVGLDLGFAAGWYFEVGVEITPGKATAGLDYKFD